MLKAGIHRVVNGLPEDFQLFALNTMYERK